MSSWIFFFKTSISVRFALQKHQSDFHFNVILNRIDLVWHTVVASSAQVGLHAMVKHISETLGLSDSSLVRSDSKKDLGSGKCQLTLPAQARRHDSPSFLVSLSLWKTVQPPQPSNTHT